MISVWWYLLDIYLASEVVWRLYLTFMLDLYDRDKPKSTLTERRSLFSKCLESESERSSASSTHFISGWFDDAPLESIHRENINDWLAWAFFSDHVTHLTDEDMGEIHDLR